MNQMDSHPIYKTRFYSDCIGIFQGGGCRAVAFAGAYDAAFKLGVRFSETAGTSAGSIVAALLAAGATPEMLLAKLRALDFAKLQMRPSRSTFARVPRFLSLLQKVPFQGKAMESLVRIACAGGLYSSQGIESWVEACLKELTGKQNGVVTFGDLLVPLSIVAGDLSTMKPKVWSSQTTPNQSVAHAVQASCSIPFFFQPVEEGSALLVDGGIVSNLPHFLFANEVMRPANRKPRVLLFMLGSMEPPKRAHNLIELISQIASLAVDGGTNVQLSFTPDIARIVIPTGSIKATDFNDMSEANLSMLIENGFNATDAFIKHELLNTHGGSTQTHSIADEHEAYLTIAEHLYTTRAVVRISMPDTRWFWELFPTILHWRKAGIRIVGFAQPISVNLPERAKEQQRRTLLEGMGVELVVSPTLPFSGILFDTPDASPAAITFPGERSDYEPAARFYSGRIDQAVLVALHERLPLPRELAVNSGHKPQLVSAPDTTFLDRLRNHVQFYREPGVTLTVEDVELSKVFLISKFVRAFRYRQIGSLVDHYKESGLELFEPAKVLLYSGGDSLVTPPVVEETGAKCVALEGNARFLYCFNNGITKIRAIVVRGVKAEFPGKPVALQQVRITALKHPPSERMLGFNHELFRSIERAVRPIATE